jgi:hypothetical protein
MLAILTIIIWINSLREIKNALNRVDLSNGRLLAFWRGRLVRSGGSAMRFADAVEAWAFLRRCDVGGKIVSEQPSSTFEPCLSDPKARVRTSAQQAAPGCRLQAAPRRSKS